MIMMIIEEGVEEVEVIVIDTVTVDQTTGDIQLEDLLVIIDQQINIIIEIEIVEEEVVEADQVIIEEKEVDLHHIIIDIIIEETIIKGQNHQQ